MKSSLLVLTLLMFLGCSKKESFRSEHPEVYMAQELPDDIKVPLKMWNFFDAQAEGFIFSEVKVWLKEKNPKTLVKPSLRIDFPKGGGEVDLSNFVSSGEKDNGSFFVGFDFPEFEEATMKKVLFISRAKKRRLDGEIWGSGCNKVVDITNHFLKAMEKDGIKVNSTRLRHLSVLGGTFILAATKDGQNFITQVTFKDSGNLDLFCSEAP